MPAVKAFFAVFVEHFEKWDLQYEKAWEMRILYENVHTLEMSGGASLLL